MRQPRRRMKSGVSTFAAFAVPSDGTAALRLRTAAE
jgi:hypothetical protein